ncbi:MAG: hypothetical protein Q4A25_00870 [Candidatus Saccharibacteria bacterium]|nr:hypothetical protein [Candidatus Saccharibacteria bacterium]
MNLRELTPEESAVLDAIIEQRINSFGYIFKYDFKEAQEYLNRNGAAKKYLITAMRQMEIAIKLMIDQVIDADCLVNMDFVNNYRSVIDPNYIPNKSLP